MWGLIDEKYCKNDFWVQTLKDIAKEINPNDQISSNVLSDFQKKYMDMKKTKFQSKSRANQS